MTTEFNIITYIIDDMKSILENGILEDNNRFPITKTLSSYLQSNTLGVNIIDGIICDMLIEEYIDYITSGSLKI